MCRVIDGATVDREKRLLCLECSGHFGRCTVTSLQVGSTATDVAQHLLSCAASTGCEALSPLRTSATATDRPVGVRHDPVIECAYAIKARSPAIGSCMQTPLPIPARSTLKIQDTFL